MNLKLKLDELNKVINDLAFRKHQTNRAEVAHFCEHDGICIRFIQAGSAQAGTTWHALTPCALKPWWLVLKPARISTQQNNKKNKITTNAAKAAEIIETIEVIENA